MKTIDELAMDIEVGGDSARSTVELRVPARAGDEARTVHLTRDEARRLAALILFHAARLDRPEHGWRLPVLERRSA